MLDAPPPDPVTGLVRRAPPAGYPLGPASIAEILADPAADVGDAVALIDGDRQWTYAELAAVVGRWAGHLAALLAPGERLLWSSGNCAELVCAFLASQRLGIVWVGLAETATDTERAPILEMIEPALIVHGADDVASHADRVERAQGRAPRRVDPHAPAAIGFTSGTTGKPKGVVHSQHGMLAPGLLSLAVDPPAHPERHGSPLPLTTLNVLLLGPIAALIRHSTAVIMRRSWAEGIAADLAGYGVHRTLLVPTQLHDLVGLSGSVPSPAELRSVLVGGAGAAPEIRRSFRDRFGVRPIMSYGLSEAPTGVVRESPEGEIGESPNLPLPHVEVTVRDGELCLAPSRTGAWAGTWSPTLGYWRDPDATAYLYRDGVLHTGDVGSVGPDGSVVVSGRIVETILRGGSNIDPTEVEDALLTHDRVTAAVVLGVDDVRLGQRVHAIVEAPALSVDDLRTHAARLLSRAKVPDSITVVDELPRNDMGKVDRVRARVLLRAG